MRLFLAFCLFLNVCLYGDARSATVVQGAAPFVTMGGVNIPFGQAVILAVQPSLSANYYTLYSNNTQYQVPIGKTFKVVAVLGESNSTGTKISFGYGDSATSSSAPTNDVPFSGSFALAGAFGSPRETPVFIDFPASKYPYVRVSDNVITPIKVLGYLK